MKTSDYVQVLREALANAAELGDEGSKRTAEKLMNAVDPALRLQMFSMVAELADEVNRLTDSVHVEVVVTPEGPDLRVSTIEPGIASQSSGLPLPGETEDEETVRITLRIPASVKAQADLAAGETGRSLNAWIVGAIRGALAQTNTYFRPGSGSTSTGVGGTLRGWVS